MRHNHWAILLAVLFQQAFGFFWYSPIGFFSQWQQALGAEHPPALPGVEVFAVAIISSAMFCYLMSWLFQVLVIDDWLRGLVVGALIGLGFLLPNLGTHYLFMGHGADLVWIDGIKEVLSSSVSGVILAVWRADISAEPAV